LTGQGKERAALSGTTLKIYRFLYKTGKPVGIREIQRELSLSSASVAEYHVKKLLSMELVKTTEDSRYFVDAVVFESMIRIRRSLIPIQVGYLAFFITSFFLLLFVLRPPRVTNDYVFALVLAAVACAIFARQALKTAKSSSI
jgi:DNA-binding transcriptional ArsR family regulator